MTKPVEQTSSYPIGDRILRLADLEAKVGLKKTKIFDDIAADLFPAPIALSGKAVGWRESEIDAWIASRPRAPRQNASLQKARAARRYLQNAAA